MRKNIFITIITIIFIITFIPKVNALCTSKKYSDLKKIAFKTELSYELKFDNDNNHYFEVYVSNLDKKLYIKFNGINYTNEKDEDIFSLNTRLLGGLTYEFNIYALSNTDCPGEFLYKKKLSIPKYNKYSEREECIEYEEFSLCNKWYQGSIPDDDYFTENLEKYIESLKKKDKEEVVEEEEKDIITVIIDFYVNNLIITLPITIVVILLLVVFIIRKIIRRKRRIKLDE